MKIQVLYLWLNNFYVLTLKESVCVLGVRIAYIERECVCFEGEKERQGEIEIKVGGGEGRRERQR